MYRLLIIFLMCMSLAGQTQPKNTNSTQLTIIVGQTATGLRNTTRLNATNSTSNQASHEKTRYLLSRGDIRNIKIVTMTVSAMGALFNAAVIFAIIIDPLKILRKGAWVTILNLAVADFISCVSCFCLWGTEFFGIDINEDVAYIATFYFAWGFGVSASFLFLTFLSVQIFVVIKFPLKSRFIRTNAKIVLAIISIWVFAFPLGLSQIAYLRWPTIDPSLIIYVARIVVLQIVLVIQVILNLQVIVKLMRSSRRYENESSENNANRNIAKTVIILTLILFLTAFPYFVFKQMEYFVRLGYLGRSETARWFSYVSYCYLPIALLNFTANPILYSLRLPEYRKTLLAFFRKSTGLSPWKTTLNTPINQTNVITLRNRRTSDASLSQ